MSLRTVLSKQGRNSRDENPKTLHTHKEKTDLYLIILEWQEFGLSGEPPPEAGNLSLSLSISFYTPIMF